ncbi:MAG TPA: hypothetical protein VGQ57_07270, partial [Polyangiaceae bacterium]|nr:hypothetical protein [Polyangiaceae bacterium]
MVALAFAAGCDDADAPPPTPPPGGAAGMAGASVCASDAEVVEHDDEVVDAPARWSGRHHVLHTLEIRAELSLDPCTVVAFDTNAFAVVDGGGAILAQGSPEAPITFTSGVMPPGRGDWAGIEIRGDAAPSVFESVTVEYAGSVYFFFGQSGLRFDDGAQVSLSHVVVR